MIKRLPHFISYFLGYRKPNHKPKTIPQWRVFFWSFFASWVGIALTEMIFTYTSSFQSHNIPMIIASFGAGAVLVYGVIESPLAQPRNVICGQCIGSIVGVIIAQLLLNIQQHWESENQKIVVQWVGGATAMSLALVLMQVTKTVHPPGGATALIAVTTTTIVDMSWLYIGVIMISVVIQLFVGCIINNIERKYPQYWWTPVKQIQFDPATISTVMPTSNIETGEKNDNQTTSSNNSSVKRNFAYNLFTKSSSSSSTIHNSINEVDETIRSLNVYANNSDIHYCLLVPDTPLVFTPGLLDNSEVERLNKILCKISFNNDRQNLFTQQ